VAVPGRMDVVTTLNANTYVLGWLILTLEGETVMSGSARVMVMSMGRSNMKRCFIANIIYSNFIS
jgi:hypothetical protein